MSESGYELVMPFLPVRSQGGPHDDDAYTAGWEMGKLDATLEYQRPAVLELPIHEANREQADLIAMKWSYRGEVTDADPTWHSGWLVLRLTKLADAPAAQEGPDAT